ncbi:hypothetical protein SDC9_76028 [bioreactor metagenome]|uniref:Uncharacterized protein n=1 Tax=bioreactor metagenome TaxID=1076179 RepID=A0A644YNB9_9ZZZZ
MQGPAEVHHRADLFAGRRAEGRHNAREDDGIPVDAIGCVNPAPLQSRHEVPHVEREGAEGGTKRLLPLYAA